MDEVSRYLTEDLLTLIDMLQGSDVRELELRQGESHIRIHRASMAGSVELMGPVETAEPVTAEPSSVEVTAPLVGTFYRASNPGMEPFVAEGAVVDEGTVVGIVEALHVLTEVEAGCTGTIVRVLATDGQPVQYGQPLFEVALSG